MSSPNSGYVGRFAPSPTGALHFGSLVAALGSWLDARQHDGEWLLRVEDLDPPREVPGAARQQLATLSAFGLHPDREVIWQSQRSERYAEVLQGLVQQDLAFACSCSRSDLADFGQAHRCCVRPFDPNHHAIRLRVADVTLSIEDRLRGVLQQWPGRDSGDFVLRRADGPFAYQLAVVVDDADQGVSDVVRGADLLDSCARQVLLYQSLGWTPPRYMHLPLVVDAQGRKLSKSSAAVPVDADDPVPALTAAWRVLGQAPEAAPRNGSANAWLRAVLPHFDWRRIGQGEFLDRSLTDPPPSHESVTQSEDNDQIN
ncbi:tRNA glutamyl-Q(34) synthetase GluQRS [Pseudomarimonas arenosa]|uniref:tRNA glutamyl-Q(34) synthetase GluQRS n=1 Tax=Pseudomarimonas arenosa TaxID=2774145 RepID=UPI002FC377AD